MAGAGTGTDETPLDHGVRNANRVVEEYLRAGEASARAFQRAGGSGRPDDIAQRMVRAASDFTTFWLELMTRSTAFTDPVFRDRQPATAASPTESDAPRATERAPLRVCVEVDADRPVAVTVDVKAEYGEHTLYVDRLHARTGSARPLTGVQIEARRGEPLRVRVTAPATQPAGTYRGVVLDEATSLPVGTLSVTLHPARRTTRRTRRS